jgi:hypothetical protein
LKLDIFANQSDRDRVVVTRVMASKRLPFCPGVITLFQHGRGDLKGIKRKELADHGNEILLLKKQGDLVDRWHVSDDHDLLGIDLTEVGNLLDRRGLKVSLAATGNLEKNVSTHAIPFKARSIPSQESGHYS